MVSTNQRIKQILSDCCAGNASLATDILHEEFVIIHKDELPETFNSTNSNGICSSSAQEFHQPPLYFHPADGDVPGEWNRKIAYANLAVALAVEAKLTKESEVLAEEAHRLYEAACEATGVRPMAIEWDEVKGKYEAIARAARKIHGAAA